MLQIVNISSKAMKFKSIDLISTHKLFQIAAQNIAQLVRSFKAVSWLYHQLQKLPAALYFMPRISSVKTFCNFANQQMTQLKSFYNEESWKKQKQTRSDTNAEKSRPIELCPKKWGPHNGCLHWGPN